jgi:hypothetical protein
MTSPASLAAVPEASKQEAWKQKWRSARSVLLLGTTCTTDRCRPSAPPRRALYRPSRQRRRIRLVLPQPLREQRSYRRRRWRCRDCSTAAAVRRGSRFSAPTRSSRLRQRPFSSDPRAWSRPNQHRSASAFIAMRHSLCLRVGAHAASAPPTAEGRSCASERKRAGAGTRGVAEVVLCASLGLDARGAPVLQEAGA